MGRVSSEARRAQEDGWGTLGNDTDAGDDPDFPTRLLAALEDTLPMKGRDKSKSEFVGVFWRVLAGNGGVWSLGPIDFDIWESEISMT